MNIFLQEIQEQARALRDTLEYYRYPNKGATILQDISKSYNRTFITNTIFTGMGSSYFNSLISYYYLNSYDIRCEIKDTGEMLNYAMVPDKKNLMRTVYFFVSQSGESGEVISLFKKWGEDFSQANVLAITNSPESTLAKRAEIVLPTIAGNEQSVTSKTYVTGILVHFLLSRAILGKNIMKKKVLTDIINAIEVLEKGMQGEWTEWELYQIGKKIYEFLGNLNFINYIGTGPSMATVMQATLNFKEITKRYAEGITIGMFRHGPIETINKNFKCIIIVSDKTAAEQVDSIIMGILEKWGGGKVVLITPHPELQSFKEHPKLLVIENPIKNKYLAPIYEIAVLQQHMCIQAEKNGYVPGEFIHSQKITK